ncbi:MAG TPA: hypothetical protein DD740_05350 [Chryseobacterium sp.]|nr:hypothetical protein [Chryseobacterium sp.]
MTSIHFIIVYFISNIFLVLPYKIMNHSSIIWIKSTRMITMFWRPLSEVIQMLFNQHLNDFSEDYLVTFGLTAKTADDFLTDIIDLNPEIAIPIFAPFSTCSAEYWCDPGPGYIKLYRWLRLAAGLVLFDDDWLYSFSKRTPLL